MSRPMLNFAAESIIKQTAPIRQTITSPPAMNNQLPSLFRRGLPVLSGAALLLAIGTCPAASATDYVNPLIGTDAHGHVYPGATVPFGMVQLSPDTRDNTWDGCSGYHYSDASILGFSCNHLTGTGCADLGNVMLMPTVGPLQLVPGG